MRARGFYEGLKVAEPTDVLLSVRAPVGELNITLERCVIGRGLAAIRGRSADPRFVYYLLHERRHLLDSLGQGSTFEAINGTDLRGLPVVTPPLPEQRKIAAILSSVDDSIRATQAVIDQTRRVKEGLLQELLTRGMPGRHTRFKQTEIGEIPESWEVRRLDGVARIVTGRTPPAASPHLWGEDIPFVTPGDLDARRETVSDSNRRLDAQARDSIPVVPSGSVLVTCIGSTIGKAAVATTECGFNQQINAVVPTESGRFLYYVIRTMRERILALAGTQAVPIINKSTFSALLVPVPSVVEQATICGILDEMENVSVAGLDRIAGLLALKSALLQDLLTGRVRVSQ